MRADGEHPRMGRVVILDAAYPRSCKDFAPVMTSGRQGQADDIGFQAAGSYRCRLHGRPLRVDNAAGDRLPGSASVFGSLAMH